jgi:hypothetical protein
MPVKSEKQRRLMQAVAHNPAFAKRVGIPQKVGKEFIGKAAGGNMKESKAMVKEELKYLRKGKAPKQVIEHEKKEHEQMKMARGGGVESKGKTKGKMVKMSRGGGVEVRGKTRGKMV